MNLSEILNSDLSTIIRELRRGFDRWIDELAALLPQSIRATGLRARAIIVFDGQSEFKDAAGTAIEPGTPTARRNDITVVVRSENALIRAVTTPVMTRADLSRMLALNAERYFPVPGGSVLVASAVGEDSRANGTMRSDLAALPIVQAQRLADALHRLDIRPRSVRVTQDGISPDVRFDFLPALRAAGMVGNFQANRQIWWALVAALALLNLAMVAWRDSADVDRLQALVDGQGSAVAVAQRITSQMRATQTVAVRSAARRERQEPLAVLAQVTAAIPDGAWVQRYSWSGSTLRLTGYRTRDTDAAAAIRKISGVSNVKSAQTDAVAETATGQPFDLVADIGGR
jgi:Tfp pilus assembly protein PilN